MAKRSTKQQLLLSAISLLLCVSMLVGSTFAWFTDTVTSTNNIIKSGTLDVSMEWLGDKADPNATDAAWKDASQGAIFDYSLWEPGYTQVRHVKIENEGTLALKYTVTITAYDENGAPLAPENVSILADVIDVYYIDPAVQVTDRTAFDDDDYLGTLRDVLKGLNQTANGTLEKKGDSDIVTLALKMREEANNDYQNKSIGASFAVTLFATQLEYEGDSFDNKYDEDADYPASNSIFLAKKGDTGVVAEGDVRVAVTAPADATTFTLNVVDNGTTTDASGNTTAAYDIELLLNNEKAPAGSYEVTIKVGSFLNITEVTHNGTAVTPFDYDKLHGILTFTTDSFSPFTVTYTEAENVLESGNYVITEDIVLSETEIFEIPEGEEVTLDLAGNDITAASHKSVGPAIKNNGTLTIKGGTVSSTAANGGSAIQNNGTLIVEDATLNGATNEGESWPSYTINNTGKMTLTNTKITSVHGAVCSYGAEAVLTLNNCEIVMSGIPGFTSHALYTYDGGQIIVNGGKYANNDPNQNATGASCVNGDVTINEGNFVGRIENYYGDPVIKSGTFTADPSRWLADGSTANNNGDGTWTVTLLQETLTNTINNAPNGSTIILPKGEYSIPTLNGKEGITIEGVPGTVIGGESAVTGFGGNFGKDTTVKNITFAGNDNGVRWSYANGGTTVFENCTFAGDSVYGFHIDQSNGATFIFNNCTFSGFNAFAGDLESITFNNCTFLHNGNYGHTNIWSVAYLNNCTFGANATISGKLYIDGKRLVSTSEELIAAINEDVEKVILDDGDYALRFTNNTSFNVDGMTISALGNGANLSISSTEVGYGRIQGNGVTFNKINFVTDTVGATGEATYNDCTFNRLECASSGNAKTYVNDCTIGTFHTSVDFTSGDAFVNGSNITKAEYSGADTLTIYFEDCTIGELIPWNINTVLTKCNVTTIDESNMTTNKITIK